MKIPFFSAAKQEADVETRAKSETSYTDPIANSGFDFLSLKNDTLSVVHGCVRIRSNTVAQLPLKIYHKLDKGREEASEHPYWRLLTAKPNGFQTPYQLLQWLVRQIDMDGNAYVRKVHNQLGRVIALVPINADTVTVTIDADTLTPIYKVTVKGVSTYFGAGYPQPAEDIIHFKDYSSNGVVGMSRLETFRSLFANYSVLESAGNQIAKNSAKAPHIVQYPQTRGKDEELNKLKNDWKAGLSGDHAGNTAWLPDVYKVIAMPNGLTAEQAQFIEQKRFTAQRIATDIYGIPLHMLGLTSSPTYASVEQMSIEFVTHTIAPIIVNIEQTLNNALFDGDTDYYVKFNVKSLLRGDEATRRQLYTFFLQNGCMTPNQINDLEDNGIIVPPEQGGDTYVRPANITPATPQNSK